MLLELRHATEAQVRDVLRRGGVRAPLGALLVELGRLNPHDLKRALALQRERPGTPLGEILADNHFLAEADVLTVLAGALGME